ncbi:MAG: hypothetical protein U1F42_09190 [Candidatus Competibacteraceae bacterium]
MKTQSLIVTLAILLGSAAALAQDPPSPAPGAVDETLSNAELRQQRQPLREQRQPPQGQQAQADTPSAPYPGDSADTDQPPYQSRERITQDYDREPNGQPNQGYNRSRQYGDELEPEWWGEGGADFSNSTPWDQPRPPAPTWQQGPAPEAPTAQNWRDPGPPSNRRQRLWQLERRVDALERTLQEVLNNQRQLLGAPPPPP